MKTPQRRPLPPQDVLLALFDYDPDTGVLRYKSTGETAGLPVRQGPKRKWYLTVAHIYAHRIIWKMVTGAEPNYMDHANGDGLDNRWDNLRPCTNGENMWNQERVKLGVSGIRGVQWSEQKKKWRAALVVDGRKIRKYFRDKHEAGAWREAKAKELHGRFYKPPPPLDLGAFLEAMTKKIPPAGLRGAGGIGRKRNVVCTSPHVSEPEGGITLPRPGP